MTQIHNFITAVKRRLNFRLALKELINSLLLMFAGMLLVCMFFIPRGYKVELEYFIFPAGIALLFFLIRYFCQRYDYMRAAEYADRHFILNEALVSVIDFKRKGEENGFHKLHLARTENKCAEQDPRLIKITVPWFNVLVSSLLFLLVGVLSIMDDSPEITARRNRRDMTRRLTTEINEQLKKEFENIQKQLTPEEQKIAKQAELEKYLQRLETRENLKDAMRQYARLERQIERISQSEQVSRNEKLLREIARQLMRSRDTRRMGEMFDRGQYKNAANELKKYKSEEPEENNKFNQLKKSMNAMREASENLSGNDSQLKQDIKELEKAMEKLEKAMRQAGRDGKDCRKCSNCNSLNKDMNKKLNKLADSLSRQQTAKDFMAKMQQLRNAMRAAQNKMCKQGNGMKPGGMGNKPGNGNNPGQGPGIGSAAAGNFNNEKSGDDNSGFLSRVEGMKGDGLTSRKVESALDGSAVSRRGRKILDTEFKYRMEEFINRGDVPDSMKSGVKKYFSTIHENQ